MYVKSFANFVKFITLLGVSVVFFLTSVQTHSQTSTQTIIDGDLVTTDDSFDIYIVKLVSSPAGEKKFKRLILNPNIFNSYGHLRWEDVKTIANEILGEYTLSELVVEVNADDSIADPKVYRVSSTLNSDVGERRWLDITSEEFKTAGYDSDSIYHVNHTEASPDFYPTREPVTFKDIVDERRSLFGSSNCEVEVPTTHSTIQAAIDYVGENDRVCVRAGTYQENLNINGKNIILSGVGAENTTIKAVRDSEDPNTASPKLNSTITISDVSSATLIERISITNGNYYAVWIDNASPVITDTIIKDNYAGIKILGVSRPTIKYNVFFNNTHGNAIIHNGDVGGYAIDHNTFVNNGNSGGSATILFDSIFPNTPVSVTNNIFNGGVAAIREVNTAFNFSVNNNLFYNNSGAHLKRVSRDYYSASSLNALSNASGNIVADAILDSNYRPGPNSPARGIADDGSNIGAY